jgi:hypothetical protein
MAPRYADAERLDPSEIDFAGALWKGKDETRQFLPVPREQPKRRIKAARSQKELTEVGRRRLMKERIVRKGLVKCRTEWVFVATTVRANLDAIREARDLKRSFVKDDMHRVRRAPEPVSALLHELLGLMLGRKEHPDPSYPLRARSLLGPLKERLPVSPVAAASSATSS